MPLCYYLKMLVHSKYTEFSQQLKLKERSHVTDVLEQDTHQVPIPFQEKLCHDHECSYIGHIDILDNACHYTTYVLGKPYRKL